MLFAIKYVKDLKKKTFKETILDPYKELFGNIIRSRL